MLIKVNMLILDSCIIANCRAWEGDRIYSIRKTINEAKVWPKNVTESSFWSHLWERMENLKFYLFKLYNMRSNIKMNIFLSHKQIFAKEKIIDKRASYCMFLSEYCIRLVVHREGLLRRLIRSRRPLRLAHPNSILSCSHTRSWKLLRHARLSVCRLLA